MHRNNCKTPTTTLDVLPLHIVLALGFDITLWCYITSMKKYISPLVLAHPIFIEETFAVGSAITGPQSSDSVTTEWEVG